MTDVTGKGLLFTDYTYQNIGIPVNPLLAPKPANLGLGGFLADPSQNGKFKVSTLRNIALTAPYGHNGYFPTLKDIINFKNTRSVGDWAVPEVSDNLNTDDNMDNLGLTDPEVDDIIKFLMTLTDF